MRREWHHKTEVQKVCGQWTWRCKLARCPRCGRYPDWAKAIHHAAIHAFLGGYRNIREPELATAGMEYIPHKCDLTDDEILERSRQISYRRVKARQAELAEQKRLRRVQIEGKLKQDIEAVLNRGLSDDQLERCINAFEEYRDAIEWL